jgi:copper transport protein
MSNPAARRAAAALISVLGALMLLLAAAPAASAHAVLESSAPGDGQVLAAGKAPTSVTIAFDEPVESALGSVEVVSANGKRVDLAAGAHPGGDGRRVSVALRSGLPAGSYLVLWRVVSADSHPVSGSFTFSVGHPGAVASAKVAAGSATVATVLVVLRLLTYAGVLGVVGALAFLMVCWPSGWSDRRAGKLLRTALAAAAIGTLLSIGVQAANDVGNGLSSSVDPAAVRALLATQYGHAHLLRLAVLAILALLIRLRRSRPQLAASGAALVVLLISVALDGHSGVGSGVASWVALDVAHVGAAGVWLGGLAMLAFTALPAARQAIRTSDAAPLTPVLVGAPVALAAPASAMTAGPPPAGPNPVALLDVQRVARRFSGVALGAVTILVASGVVQAWRQVGELGALTGTNYGRLLLLKVGLLVVTLCFAAVSRRAVHARIARSQPRLSMLSRSVAAELAVLVAVLGVTSVLVATTPARAAYRPAQSATVHAGPDTIQLSAVPVQDHSLELHLYVFGRDGLPADVPQLEAQAELPGSQLGEVSVPLTAAGNGHFVAGHVLLPQAGTWILRLVLQTSEFDAYNATTTLKVR